MVFFSKLTYWFFRHFCLEGQNTCVFPINIPIKHNFPSRLFLYNNIVKHKEFKAVYTFIINVGMIKNVIFNSIFTITDLP